MKVPKDLVSVGIALHADGRRVGEAWPLAQHDGRMPTAKEVAAIHDRLAEQLGATPYVLECYARLRGGHNGEGHTLYSIIPQDKLGEWVLDSIESTVRGAKIFSG